MSTSNASNFVQNIITEDMAGGLTQIHTRFPPEPNGYLHVGHAKSICLNFGLAEKNGGLCNLRFDDTNPVKEDTEYVDAIEEDVKWLGFSWAEPVHYASDYFDKFYEAAMHLIKKGLAFVCDLSADEMKDYRGTLTEPGKNSPYRDRTVEENLALFTAMKNGEFEDGSRVLRAKIDMASPNLNLRDPVIYRIAKAHHHRTGDKWCIYPMYDFARKVGGDRIQVKDMVPAGTEPHDWEPAATDIRNLEDADVFVYNGADLEHWAEDVLDTLENQDLVVSEASDGVELLDGGHDHAHGDEGKDPHVWLDPMRAKQEMKNIRDALVKADPGNGDYYEANYEKYAGEFDELDQEFRDGLKGTKNRDIIVAHEAFGYLCNAYDLTQLAIEGLTPDSEPDPAKIQEVIEYAKKYDIHTIFFEELVSPKVAKTVAKEVDAVTAVLNPIEGLSEEDIEAGEDYFSVMRKNLEALQKALN